MSDQNSFHFIGRLVQSAELKHVGQENTPCVKFSIAVNNWSKLKQCEEVSYFNLVYFGRTAENKHKLLTKGIQVSAKGICRQERWEKDGQKQSRVAFMVNDLQILTFKKPEEIIEHPTQQELYQETESEDYP